MPEDLAADFRRLVPITADKATGLVRIDFGQVQPGPVVLDRESLGLFVDELIAALEVLTWPS